MKKVYFATGNRGKYEILKDSLNPFKIDVVHVPINFPKELDSPDLAKIASDKVVKAFAKIKKPVVSHDSGFYIRSLDGFPGHKVNPALKDLGVEWILKRVGGKDRYCEFRQCLAFINHHMESPKIFESVTSGYLSEEIKGTLKDKNKVLSELWLVFIPEDELKTLAEMSEEEWKEWRARRGDKSVDVKFGKWYSKTVL